MSKIDKLSILGVRSFDNIRSETIQFHTPLTLIVGYNGSGKTTIIECLKYATTGQLPPNSKGGAFIHDPKLCGEKEVLAQVKLSFKGTTGAKLVVTRSLQLTVKKTTRTQKTLEGQLLMIKDGERTTLSSRVAELDQIMPQYLGVSEAILDNVIFCHQDESLWPMSEPGTLKKKFDEIFEALKYTKAIENIKTLRKKQGNDLVLLKANEAQFKIDKDRGDRAEKQSTALQNEIEKLREQSDELNRQMQIALDSAKAKHQEANSFLRIVNELTAKRNRAQERQENVDDLRANLEERSESDEWLESTLAEYEEKMVRFREEEKAYQADYREFQEELKQTRNQLASKLAEQGQHQAEKENYERQIDARITLVKDAARRHAMRGYEGDIDETQIRDFADRVSRVLSEKMRELERAQKATEDELQQSQAVISDFESRRSAHTQDRVSAKQTITNNDKKINSIQEEMDSINIDEGVKAVLDSSHEDLKSRLKRVTIDFEEAMWDTKLQAENLRLHELEDENTRLNEQLLQTTRIAGERAQLDFTKKELKDRQRSLDTMISTHGESITSIVGPNWQPSTLEREFQAALNLKTQSVDEAQRQQDGLNRELQQVEFKLSTTREDRKRKIVEMREAEKVVLNSIILEGQPLETVDEYLAEVEKLEKDRDIIKSDIENFTNLNDFYTTCLKVVEQKNHCHLCDRKFAHAEEKSSAIAKLRQKLATDARASLIIELQTFDEELKLAQSARSQYETHLRLSATDIPSLEKEIKMSEDQRGTLLASAEEQDAIVLQEVAAKREVDALSKTISSVARYFSEISGFESEVARLSSQHKSAGSLGSLEEIQTQLGACAEQTRTLKSTILKMTTERDRAKALINTLELELRDAASKLSKAGYQMEKKQSLVSRIHELKDSNTLQLQAILRADTSLESLGPQLSKAKAQYADIQQRGRAKEKDIHADTSRLTETVNKLKLTDDSINAYIDAGGPNKLKSSQRSIKMLEQELTRIEGEISDVTAKANTLKDQVDNSENTKRNISDNIKFRKNLKALEVLNGEIKELESKNATEDYHRLEAEANKLDLRHQTLLAERGPILGKMRAKDDELARLLEEWETDYKGAARKYRESHIKVETTKAAIDDLGRYGTALDQAIMKYHSIKMEEINRIAGELWQSTYQGTDVDTILIRSDAENTTSKRNYNYRVCMVKQDAEMDMRGRCSAGQRVLASIIIRLALAECFGVNCGLIALDEPTTNLDRDNIRSLAESLHGIIKARQAQANFQLIVITHDEEFLRFMKCADFCDNYYRVSRDDKQKSVIERQSIAQVI